jgi:predicted PurR-regulated permease PerM
MSNASVAPRAIVRIVLIIVGVFLTLYLIYLLRKPIGWLCIAGFIAIALSGPVNYLNGRMRRGFAITLVYLGLLAVPIALTALIVPPIVTQGTNLAENAPEYANDVTNYVERNKTLRDLDEKYDVTTKLEEEAGKLPNKIGDAAGVLRDVGFGLVNSIFAMVTILILSVFMVSNGRRWVDALIRLQPPDRQDRLQRMTAHIAQAVGNYVAGAIIQAVIAGITTYIVLVILGVPFRAPLAVLVALFDLVPLVGATIGAIIVGLVTLFTDFPTATIVWAIWAIVYQQIENTVIQPQVQKRALEIHPFAVLVAVLFGSTLLGVLGALVAIPAAAAVQIAIKEYWDYRRTALVTPSPPPEDAPPPPPGIEPATA